MKSSSRKLSVHLRVTSAQIRVYAGDDGYEKRSPFVWSALMTLDRSNRLWLELVQAKTTLAVIRAIAKRLAAAKIAEVFAERHPRGKHQVIRIDSRGRIHDVTKDFEFQRPRRVAKA